VARSETLTAPAAALPGRLSAVTDANLADLAARAGEPAFLAERRARAWAFTQATPFPSRIEELWRRTDISGLDWDSLLVEREPHPAARSAADLPAELSAEIGPAEERSALVVTLDRDVVLLERDLARDGITVAPLAEAARDHADLVQRLLGTTVRFDESRFTGLNAALRSPGVLVHVPAGVHVKKPIRVLIALETPDLAIFPHTIVALERGAKATVIEEYVSTGEHGSPVAVPITEITVGDEADLHLATLYHWGGNVRHFGVERARIGREGRFHWTFAGVGGKLVKSDMEIHLEGEGAEGKFSGCYFGSESQHFDFHTFQNHVVGHTTSDLLFKGALRGRARTIYQGLIRVHKNAQRSDAYQANRNLILSDKARADSIPSLEIEANDVRCTHGATVGQVDEEQLFYLMARGLAKPDAERLIIAGFFEPVLERIPSETLRALVTETIDRKAGGDLKAAQP
jgi:Fe-S cluster assembly protein SufD